VNQDRKTGIAWSDAELCSLLRKRLEHCLLPTEPKTLKGQIVRGFRGKGSRKSESFWIFRESNHSTKNSRKTTMNSNETEISMHYFFSKDFRYTSRNYPLFRKLCKFAIFYSALVVLVAITLSELDIPRIADGHAYSKMDEYFTLESWHLPAEEYS